MVDPDQTESALNQVQPDSATETLDILAAQSQQLPKADYKVDWEVMGDLLARINPRVLEEPPDSWITLLSSIGEPVTSGQLAEVVRTNYPNIPDSTLGALTAQRRHFAPRIYPASMVNSNQVLILGGIELETEAGVEYYTSTMSEPGLVARQLFELEVLPGHSVLEIGSGSGYVINAIQTLVGPTGNVTGMEIIPDLVEASRRKLSGDNVQVVQVVPGEVTDYGENQFDRILYSCSPEIVPAEVITALKPGGTICYPAYPISYELDFTDTATRDECRSLLNELLQSEDPNPERLRLAYYAQLGIRNGGRLSVCYPVAVDPDLTDAPLRLPADASQPIVFRVGIEEFSGYKRYMGTRDYGVELMEYLFGWQRLVFIRKDAAGRINLEIVAAQAVSFVDML